jgi:HAD superfamily hydrolase (TIGR01549 family)
MTPPVTHLLIDFFGTLVEYDASRRVQGFAHTHRFLQGDCGCALGHDEFLALWDQVWTRFERATPPAHDEFAMDAVVERFLAEALGCTPRAEWVAGFRHHYLDEWAQGLGPIDGVPQLIADLARRYTLVLVSNTNDHDLVPGQLRAMGVDGHFSQVVLSVAHGKRKPAAAIFEHALACSGGRKVAALHVGDSFEADYQGALGAGLRCLLIDPAARHPVPEGDRIASILELRERLLPH